MVAIDYTSFTKLCADGCSHTVTLAAPLLKVLGIEGKSCTWCHCRPQTSSGSISKFASMTIALSTPSKVSSPPFEGLAAELLLDFVAVAGESEAGKASWPFSKAIAGRCACAEEGVEGCIAIRASSSLPAACGSIAKASKALRGLTSDAVVTEAADEDDEEPRRGQLKRALFAAGEGKVSSTRTLLSFSWGK